ncbi:histidine ammonia-lyase [Parachlamydia acanthamoebae UV-7]|jgi:histidine ammonia-lyase|uniref:Histidine ammonia-lyase n=2 Tax=Parachlamydia acanthamoebae TaxID=83552 RepID=F8KW80_PARAV|nr:histidine ammonia-lyase [Parachlamydia acanthamoebae]CCB85867.1 histidine ammonia-lyase [Parachlamydia acanthamoebae UV-7]
MKQIKDSIFLDGKSLTLSQVEAIAKGCPVKISPSTQNAIDASAQLVHQLAKSPKPIYGVNTGFGYFAREKIAPDEIDALQVNLLKSHAAGFGEPLSLSETRLAMALRLNVLIKGNTGVRYQVCEALLQLIQAEIYPLIPQYGSVGASGDLAPLAHLALPLIGLGEVHYKDKRMSAKEALKLAKLKPLKLYAKEGLGLINGTQIMLAVGSLALIEAKKVLKKADRIAALTFEGLLGATDALNPLLHRARGQKGQMEIAKRMREELKDSSLWSQNFKRVKVQDSYSLRCVPQIHGPTQDALDYCTTIIERELNAATDNPLVFSEEGVILSGGNFHGQALALAFDFAAIAMSEISNVSERRLETLLNPHMSGLPAFLTPYEGTHSGYMASQYLSASLVNQNKLLANPACTDSIPGNVGVEDHVSMGMTSARKLRDLVRNVSTVLAIEMVVAAQAVDLRKRSQDLGKGTHQVYIALRKKVPVLIEDRIVSDDIQKALEVFQQL